jgi:hypothetical protein
VNNEVLLAAKCNPLDQAMSTKAQNDWQAPSNAYVAAMYPETNGRAWYGSTLPTEKDLLLAQLTRLQIAAMTDLFRRYTKAKHSHRAAICHSPL